MLSAFSTYDRQGVYYLTLVKVISGTNTAAEYHQRFLILNVKVRKGTHPVLWPLPAGEQTHPFVQLPVQSDACAQPREMQPVSDEEERVRIGHPLVETEHRVLPWLLKLEQRLPSSCSDVLLYEEA